MQIRDPALMGHVAGALEAAGAVPGQLEICVPSAVLAEPDETLRFNMAALFDEGVSIAIDRFGESLAAVRLLQRVPIHRVKLARSLARDVVEDAQVRAVVQASVVVAHAVGAGVVATGVDSEDQLRVLAGLGCDEAQGTVYGELLELGALRGLAR